MTRPDKNRQGFFRRLVNRLLHVHFLAARGLTLGVRAFVRSPEGKLLLVRHTYIPGWHFPGGGVERNEASEVAMIRELRQEAGLTVKGRPVLHGVFFNGGISKRDHVLVYLCETEGQVPPKPPSLEIAEIGFFDVGKLPEDTDPGTLRRVGEILGGQERSPEW